MSERLMREGTRYFNLAQTTHAAASQMLEKQKQQMETIEPTEEEQNIGPAMPYLPMATAETLLADPKIIAKTEVTVHLNDAMQMMLASPEDAEASVRQLGTEKAAECKIKLIYARAQNWTREMCKAFETALSMHVEGQVTFRNGKPPRQGIARAV